MSLFQASKALCSRIHLSISSHNTHFLLSSCSKDRRSPKKEAPVCASPTCENFDARASLTVEAAVVFPVFLFLMIFVMFFMRILWTQAVVQNALDETSQQMAVAAAYKEDISLAAIIAIVDAKLVADEHALSYIDNGILGLDYSDSDVDDNYISLKLQYDISFPISYFGTQSWSMYQVSVNRKWIGWDADEEDGDGEYVYITDTGTVYHIKRSCTYLNPSIKAISYSSLSTTRNSSGSTYSACKSCNKSGTTLTVYVTDYGTVYHSSISCSALKRTIKRVLLSEVSGMGACSKCGN